MLDAVSAQPPVHFDGQRHSRGGVGWRLWGERALDRVLPQPGHSQLLSRWHAEQLADLQCARAEPECRAHQQPMDWQWGQSRDDLLRCATDEHAHDVCQLLSVVVQLELLQPRRNRRGGRWVQPGRRVASDLDLRGGPVAAAATAAGAASSASSAVYASAAFSTATLRASLLLRTHANQRPPRLLPPLVRGPGRTAGQRHLLVPRRWWGRPRDVRQRVGSAVPRALRHRPDLHGVRAWTGQLRGAPRHHHHYAGVHGG